LVMDEGRLEVDDDKLDNEDGKLKGPGAWFILGEGGMPLTDTGRLERAGGRLETGAGGGREEMDSGRFDKTVEWSIGAGFGATLVMVIDL